MPAGRFLDWIDDRTGFRAFKDAMLLEHVPGGARWRYVWGSTLVFVFALQVVTGILLMTAYSPSDTTAWASVHFIQYQMDFGWLIRGLHHFGSQTMMVLIALHMLQVVLAGAQLPPREFNWWLGMGLLAVTFGLGLTGYLLPWDQKGYWATRVATSIAGTLPGGDAIRETVVGGPDYGNHTLTRFFALHVGILPAAFVLLLVVHVALFRRHGITAPLNARRTKPVRFGLIGLGIVLCVGGALALTQVYHAPIGWLLLFPVPLLALDVLLTVRYREGVDEYFWPGQVFRDLIACLLVFGALLAAVCGAFGTHGSHVTDEPPDYLSYEFWAHAGQHGWGANLDAPADRDTADYPARPEWYFLFLFQLLKYFEGDLMMVGTVHIPNGVFLLLFLLPLFGAGRLRPFGYFFGILVMVALLSAVAVLTALAFASDCPECAPRVVELLGGDEKEQTKARESAKLFEDKTKTAQALAQRAAVLGMQGIPDDGPRQLLRNDPLTKGHKLFESNCAVCHQFTAQPGDAFAGFTKGAFKAPDLGDYGTEQWVRGLLNDPGHAKYFGSTGLGGMKSWRKGVDRALKKMKPGEIAEQDADFDLIAKGLADQSRPVEKRDKELTKKGLEAFERQECSLCHTLGTAIGDDSAPDLTGWGSQDWIRMMVMAPGHKTRFGKNNEMPPFRNKEGPGSEVALREFLDANPDLSPAKVVHLSDVERELVIRFLTRDHRVVFGGRAISGPPPQAAAKQ